MNRFAAIAILFTFACAARAGRLRSADGCEGSSGPCTGRGSLSFDGRVRTWRVHVPAHAPDELLPAIVSLHGRLGTGEAQEELAHFDRVADANRFVIVEPDGVDRSWNDPRGTTPASRQHVDDDGFLAALLDALPRSYGVDPHRVYLSGMSNGAFMATAFACAHADRVAALAAVAGGFSDVAVATCHPAKAVPVLLVLGDQDPLVPYSGGEMSGRGVVLSGPQMLESWAKVDGCTGSPPPVEEPDRESNDGTRVRREVRDGCRGGARVELVTVVGGGHAWPGGKAYAPAALIGRTSREFDASERMAAFFAEFRRE